VELERGRMIIRERGRVELERGRVELERGRMIYQRER